MVFTTKHSTYRISHAPTGRGKCRKCKQLISKGAVRIEICAFVRPGRSTLLLRCTSSKCIDERLCASILAVYANVNRVPVEVDLDGSEEADRVRKTIRSAVKGER